MVPLQRVMGGWKRSRIESRGIQGKQWVRKKGSEREKKALARGVGFRSE